MMVKSVVNFCFTVHHFFQFVDVCSYKACYNRRRSQNLAVGFSSEVLAILSPRLIQDDFILLSQGMFTILIVQGKHSA